MNVGIIVFSQTGNTLSVAQRLQEALTASGHQVTIDRVEISGELGSGQNDFQLTRCPDVAPYEAIVFAGPVMAFALNPAMKRYMGQIGPLVGKPAACLVTKQLPYYWTGGRPAVRRISRAVRAKGGKMLGSGIVIWGSDRREEMIAEVVERVSGLFG